ncbi:MAG: hypothetical protein RJA07_2570, partial [Bacteroidota bacterium]
TAAGNWQWARSMGSTVTPVAGGVEKTNCMKTDNKGNTYTCGYMYYNPKVQGLHGGKAITQLVMNHSNMNNTVGFIAKHDCNGNLEWINLIYDTINGGVIKDFAVDTNGNVYLSAELNNWGISNIYWNDSLIKIPTNPTNIIGGEVIFKIDKNGKLKWRWSPIESYGNNAQIQYASIGNRGYMRNEASFMLVKDSTLFILGEMDTVVIQTLRYLSLIEFNTNTGQFIKRSRVYTRSGNLGFECKGFGMNQQGDFLAALNIQQDTLKILDTTLVIPNNYDRGVMFSFNKTHVIKLYTLLHDTATFYSCDMLSNTNSFTIGFGSRTGEIVVGNYVMPTHTHDGPIFQGFDGSYPIAKFTDIDKMEWAVAPDTLKGAGGIFLNSASDKTGKIYTPLYISDYVKMKNMQWNLPTQHNWNPIVKWANNKDSIIDTISQIKTIQGNIYGHYVNINYLSIHENGNISASGEFKSNSIITPNDTAPSFGGNNDLFVIKYGNDCNDTNALIEPVATELLMATCQHNDSVELNWQDKSNIEFGYHIYRAAALNGAYTLIKTLPKNSTQYTDNTLLVNTNYYYKVAAYNNIGDGTFSLDSSKSCKILGVENSYLKNNQLKIYPNPTQTGQFTIDVNGVNKENAQLQISNYIGQIFIDKQIQLHQNLNQFKIDLSNYSSGTYLVTVKTSTGIYNQKVMVVR